MDMKMKIATHDSATGERGHGWLSWLVTPFACTQSKTIWEQYDAGCRSFDIRVRYSSKRNEWVCAHGLWESERTADGILCEIDNFAERCEVCITYEGVCKEVEQFRLWVLYNQRLCENIAFGRTCSKYAERAKVKVDYTEVLPGSPLYSGGVQGFLPLDGRSWHTCLPIPWLWDRLYKRPHKFNEEKFTFVDFL